MATVSCIGFNLGCVWFEMEVNQLRDLFCWSSAATDDGSDCNGVFVNLFKEIELLGPGWGFCLKSEVFLCEWVYDSFLVH